MVTTWWTLRVYYRRFFFRAGGRKCFNTLPLFYNSVNGLLSSAAHTVDTVANAVDNGVTHYSGYHEVGEGFGNVARAAAVVYCPGLKGPKSVGRAPRGTGQLDDAISAATPVGRRGQQATFPNPSTPQPRNVPGTVNGRDFSGHAFDRMQERGFTPSVVDNAIQRGTRTPGTTPGTFHHFDPANKLNVITDAATGRVITVF